MSNFVSNEQYENFKNEKWNFSFFKKWKKRYNIPILRQPNYPHRDPFPVLNLVWKESLIKYCPEVADNLSPYSYNFYGTKLFLFSQKSQSKPLFYFTKFQKWNFCFFLKNALLKNCLYFTYQKCHKKWKVKFL